MQRDMRSVRPDYDRREHFDDKLFSTAVGQLAYAPRLIEVATAAAWFAELRVGVSWRETRRELYDREVNVPRLIGHYRLDLPSSDTPHAILAAAARIGERISMAFRVKSDRATSDKGRNVLYK
jgi:hypothetical protein